MDKTKYPRGIYKHGDNLRIRIWSKGKIAYQETIPCNPFSESDIRRVAKLRAELKVKIGLGLTFIEDTAPSELQLFSVMAQEYIDTHDGKYSTVQGYIGILNKYWIPLFGNIPCASITKRDIKKARAEQSVGSKTRDNILGALRGVLDHAEVSPNPAALIKTKKKQTSKIERYTPDERDKLLSCFSGDIYVYFALFFGCGMRPGELKGLLRTDFDGSHWQVHQQIVRGKVVNSTKTAERRKVYVPDWVKAAIKTIPPRIDSPYFFVNSDGNYYKDTRKFNRAWQKAHERKQMHYRIPYAARHTRAAELLSMGRLPPDAAVQMGHSTHVFLTTYSEFINEYAADQDPRRFEPLPNTTFKR
tara:strand:- start:293 stop:1369 length:1077 start_codon:yes stop_codon:yes gene_type:complete